MSSPWRRIQCVRVFVRADGEVASAEIRSQVKGDPHARWDWRFASESGSAANEHGARAAVMRRARAWLGGAR